MSVPARRGKKWAEDESLKLLQAVRRKETHQQIAMNHERTPGGIRSRLRQIAAEYHFYENRSMDDIMKLTGLPHKSIIDAIQKRNWEDVKKTKRNEAKAQSHPYVHVLEQKKEDMIPLLIEIRDLMKEMIELHKQSMTGPTSPLQMANDSSVFH